MDRDELLRLVLECLREHVEDLASGQDVLLNEETRLFGKNALFDSLGLISFVVDMEEKLAATFNREILLASEDAMSKSRTPFRNVSTLIDHILLVAGSEN